MTPAEVIANVLHHVEGEGLNDEHALALAGDVLHALAGAGMVVVSAEDLGAVLADRYSREGRTAAARLCAASAAVTGAPLDGHPGEDCPPGCEHAALLDALPEDAET